MLVRESLTFLKIPLHFFNLSNDTNVALLLDISYQLDLKGKACCFKCHLVFCSEYYYPWNTSLNNSKWLLTIKYVLHLCVHLYTWEDMETISLLKRLPDMVNWVKTNVLIISHKKSFPSQFCSCQSSGPPSHGLVYLPPLQILTWSLGHYAFQSLNELSNVLLQISCGWA